MKRLLFSFVCIFSIGLLFSCASDSKPADTVTETEINEPEIIEETEPIPAFDDWKYKGFGYEIPDYFDSVFISINNLHSQNAELPSEDFSFENSQIKVWCFGENPDQALHALNSVYEEKLSEFKEANNTDFKTISLIEEYWVKFNPEYIDMEKPYLALRVFKTEQ